MTICVLCTWIFFLFHQKRTNLKHKYASVIPEDASNLMPIKHKGSYQGFSQAN